MAAPPRRFYVAPAVSLVASAQEVRAGAAAPRCPEAMHQIAELPLPVRYRPEVLATLLELGVAPRHTTQPRLVYGFLRALLTYEIRERKARRRELERFFGPQPLEDYAREIENLRAKYFLLRRPPEEWVEPPA